MQALDTALQLAEAHVRLDAAGVIRRAALEYGRRGALKDFVVTTLQTAADGLTARAIAVLARDHFGFQFTLPVELSEFIESSIRPQLKKLRSQGLVTNLAGDGPDGMLWTWKSGLPTLAELATPKLERADNAKPYCVGREVAY